ncbi:MAG: hypothetical protein V1756_00455 [Patescibacteria group bacterium]
MPDLNWHLVDNSLKEQRKEVMKLRKIKGFVCVAETKRGLGGFLEDDSYLFGKNTDGLGDGSYNNIESNNLTSFETRFAARDAGREMRSKRMFRKISVAKIEISLAETQREADSLQRKTNLIVVRRMPEFGGACVLIGVSVEGRGRYPLYGSTLSRNGLKTISNFESAKWIAQEENRQAGGPVTIGTFSIKKIRIKKA